MAKTRVAVIFGGMSNEHDISLISASNVISHLDPEKYEIIPIGITRKGRWFFYPRDISRIKEDRWESDPDCVPAAILPDPLYRGIAKITDNRINFVELTDEGRKLVEDSCGFFDMLDEQMYQGFDDGELRLLCQYYHRIYQNMERMANKKKKGRSVKHETI